MCWDIMSWLRMSRDFSSQSNDFFREQTYLLSHLIYLRLGGCTSNNISIYDALVHMDLPCWCNGWNGMSKFSFLLEK
jgi:hypothetical protein